ncbi:uncharacterized protein C8Q71DRAFT_289738 [Rhodofomes roseus]|uniref:Uncharacterized protein n=1 Tax=Rhodofomes roseus TaxID=34475 RepID=A0ABQ8K3R7_9APHY|nr:uncharacterized protein C8Q71DRAFT_289738 [Rhodofomes roseus]KAH9831532.1 hypothetical protein C8Q71DRAFT_289738 [Rhodofomes roseus]
MHRFRPSRPPPASHLPLMRTRRTRPTAPNPPAIVTVEPAGSVENRCAVAAHSGSDTTTRPTPTRVQASGRNRADKFSQANCRARFGRRQTVIIESKVRVHLLSGNSHHLVPRLPPIVKIAWRWMVSMPPTTRPTLSGSHNACLDAGLYATPAPHSAGAITFCAPANDYLAKLEAAAPSSPRHQTHPSEAFGSPSSADRKCVSRPTGFPASAYSESQLASLEDTRIA